MSLFDEFSRIRVVAGGESFRRTRAVCLLLVGAFMAWGCASGPRIAASPISPEEQQRAVLKIAPLGTPRVEVTEKLKAAGIELSPGVTESIYYCDVWNRENGEHWQMDVALLFDNAGNLYQTRRAQADISVASAADAQAVSKTAQTATKPAGPSRNPMNPAFKARMTPAPPDGRTATPFQKRPDAPAFNR